jgi:hypothetical protein
MITSYIGMLSHLSLGSKIGGKGKASTNFFKDIYLPPFLKIRLNALFIISSIQGTL